MKNKLKINIVIPLFNEAENVKALFTALNNLQKKITAHSVEVILVNDGSVDKTLEQIKKNKLVFKKTIISFSRNFGHQAALIAGLEKSSGDCVITMDGDLQHPPELIPQMIKLHQDGYDVILTQRMDNEFVSPFKKFSAKLFYNLINLFSQTKIAQNSSDFRSLNRKALNSLLSMPEKRKFLRGMVSWIGFKSIIVPFEVKKRHSGVSKYSPLKMMKLAIHGVTSFSTGPLYLSGFFSLIFFGAALIYAIYVIYTRFFTDQAISGWASVTFILLVLGGFVSLFLGLLGLYLAAIYEEIKNRPIYIEDESTHEN